MRNASVLGNLQKLEDVTFGYHVSLTCRAVWCYIGANLRSVKVKIADIVTDWTVHTPNIILYCPYLRQLRLGAYFLTQLGNENYLQVETHYNKQLEWIAFTNFPNSDLRTIVSVCPNIQCSWSQGEYRDLDRFNIGGPRLAKIYIDGGEVINSPTAGVLSKSVLLHALRIATRGPFGHARTRDLRMSPLGLFPYIQHLRSNYWVTGPLGNSPYTRIHERRNRESECYHQTR